MKRLTLSLDDLNVESFDVAGGGAAARGTVHGNSAATMLDWSCRYTQCGQTCDSDCLVPDSFGDHTCGMYVFECAGMTYGPEKLCAPTAWPGGFKCENIE